MKGHSRRSQRAAEKGSRGIAVITSSLDELLRAAIDERIISVTIRPRPIDSGPWLACGNQRQNGRA